MPITYLKNPENNQDEMINAGMQNIMGGLNKLQAQNEATAAGKRQNALTAYNMAKSEGYQPTKEVLGAFENAAATGDLSGLAGALSGAPRTKSYQLEQSKTQAEIDKLRGENGKDGLASLAQTKPTQYAAAQYSNRMVQSNKIFDNLEKKGFKRQDPTTGLMSYAPEILKSSDLKSQDQAERNFINSILRKESGAAISNSEFESGSKQYFPRAGDPPEVLNQKRLNREMAIAGLKTEAGPAFEAVGRQFAQIQNQNTMPQQQGGFMQAVAAPTPQVRDLATIQARKAELMKKAGAR